jgi:AraC family transcriptional regulator, ethanolamine operon transcriptional activator
MTPPKSPAGAPLQAKLVEAAFDDVDAMAASPIAWKQEYEQIGRGRFQGQLTQLVLTNVQLGRVLWSPGVLQRGDAPKDTWVFGLPVAVEGSLHVRRRPARAGELLVATSRDDVGFSANGNTDLMVVVLPTNLIDKWLQIRRGVSRPHLHLPAPHWTVPPSEMRRRAVALSSLLDMMRSRSANAATPATLSRLESRIFDTILDMIPSAEVIEPLHSRARIARAVMRLLHERLEDPPTVTEMCERVGARERTLYLSCVEAFGRPPATLLIELRLNAARRALLRPSGKTTVTMVATHYGFTHFSRFAEMYQRQFGELPSTTLARAFE